MICKTLFTIRKEMDNAVNEKIPLLVLTTAVSDGCQAKSATDDADK